MASSPKDLHFVLFPLMQQGHMIPIIDIAIILAHRNATVTVITTPVNAARFRSTIARAAEAHLKIHVIELQLRSAEVGLPEGCENFDMLENPSENAFVKMYAAIDMLEKPSENVLRRLTPAASCIISDNQFPWTTDIARRLGVPRLVFHGPGCFTYMCLHIVMNTNVLNQINLDDVYLVVPGIPHRIELTKAQAGGWGKRETKEMKEFFDRMEVAADAADGIVVNSFNELEPEYVRELAKAKGKKVWCIGPVSLHNRSFLDLAERGNKAGIDEGDCLKWLDARDPRSVIFVCLGSMSSICDEQILELGCGLELSSTPFVWCIRSSTNDETERWLSGYEERVRDRGLIVRGWAPQVLILSHKAVGGFMTHCGWNSTLEGISAGVPMVTYPQGADQFINERFVIDVLKTGVSVGGQDKLGGLVKKDNFRTAVERVMDDKGEWKARRERARELGEMAKRAMEEGGSSYRNTTLMIQDIIDELAKKTKPSQDVLEAI